MKFNQLLLAMLAGVTLGLPAWSQASSPDARVSLRIEGRQLREVVDFLREQSGSNIVILDEEAAADSISLDVTDVPWRDALELAAELADCVVEERTAGILTLVRPEPVTFSFKDTDLTEVIDMIGRASGANIVVAPEVSGTITLRLTEVPWRDALEVACKTLGYVVVEEGRGILRVVDPVTLQAQMETRSYQMRYLRPKGNYVPVIDSEFVAGSARIPTGNIDEDFPVIEALRNALSSGGELDYVAGQNVLIVRDTAQVHAEIKTMLERLDVEPLQVFVDVKFVSTTNGDLLNLGVDYGDFGPSVSISGGQIPITLPFDLGDGWQSGILAQDNGDLFAGPADPLNPLNTNAGNTVVPDTVFGALSFTGIAPTLRLLQRDSKTEVVQAPKIIALDGREATIFVGETIRYAEARTEQGQAGGLNLSVSEASGSPVDIGFQLLVVPNIVPGTNRLTMDVIPKETSLSGTGDSTLAPPGFDVFTVGAGGADGSIALPRVRSSTIVTSMLLESGQTAVIGGLTTDTEVESESRVPYLSRIPLLGELFKYEEKSQERRSLMVFITPTIVRSARDTQDILARELERRMEDYSDRLRELVGDDLQTTTSRADGLEAPVGGGAELDVTTFTEAGR
jgi:type IV pilus assembly protein PilQ